MATAKKTTAKKTATRSNRTATTASAKGTSNATRARAASRDRHPVDVRTVATDTAYATVGAGDRAVEVARQLPVRATELVKDGRTRAESFVKDAPARAQALVKEAPTKLQGDLWTELEAYATRGRKVVDSIANAEATKRARSQTETARSQVKGAVTSVRKAVEQGGDAVGTAVGRIGNRRTA